jgi:hypothetical protein
MKPSCTRAAIVIIVLVGVTQYAGAQWRVTGGVKTWYAAWELKIDRNPGVEQSYYSPALMFGPYVTVRYETFSVTGYYTSSVSGFEASAKNPGYYSIGFNGNRIVNRQDINILAQLALTQELSVFGSVKLLKYSLLDAITYINGWTGRLEQNFNGTGIGAGVHIGVPFSGKSPYYSFISTGTVYNSYKLEDPLFRLSNGTQTAEERTKGGDAGSEFVYFLDAGIGARLGAGFGGTLGIRVENGQTTKTIIGPTFNLFYSL